MELVERRAGDLGVLAAAQRVVGEDLLGAADHGRMGVDARIAGDHAHAVAPEKLDEVKELLADQRFDGRGVVGALARGKRHEEHAERHHGLARAGGRAENHVVARRDAQKGLFLMGPQVDAARLRPLQKALERLLGVEPRLVFVGVEVRQGQLARRCVGICRIR